MGHSNCSSSEEIMRICIDQKLLNAALKREYYQIPLIDDLLPDLTDAYVFTKVNLAAAFWHLVLDDESSVLATFASPYGRFIDGFVFHLVSVSQVRYSRSVYIKS